MLKKIVILIAFVGLTLNLSSCTSGDAKEDNAIVESDMPTDLEAVEGVDVTAGEESKPVEAIAPVDEMATAETNSNESLPVDPLADQTQPSSNDGMAVNNEVAPPPIQEQAQTPPPPIQEQAQTPPPPPVQEQVQSTPEQSPMEATPPPSSIASSEPEQQMSPPAVEPTKSKKAKKPKAEKKTDIAASDVMTPPVEHIQPQIQKVVPQPWRDGEVLYNSVFFARANDSYKTIAKKIYGDSKKVDQLKKGNPGVKTPKAGDAIYYSSPNRPDDQNKMLTYYEDNGFAPEVYVTTQGENLKKLSKKLLGYSNAWKEVYATNAFDSSTEVPQGTEIKYWKNEKIVAHKKTDSVENKSNELAAAEVANQELPPPPPVQEAAQMPPSENKQVIAQELPPPPPPPPADAQAGLPPPPPPPEAGAQPPQQAAQELPPPPPPPEPMEHKQKAVKDVAREDAGGAIDEETLKLLGAVAVLAVGLVGFIIVRKKRKQKEMEQVLESTHIG